MSGPGNWIRLVLCGAIAGVVWNLLSTATLAFGAPDFIASVRAGATGSPMNGGFFYGIDIAMGIWAVWLYASLVPRYNAGPRTMAIAGAAWWTLKTLQSAKWAGLGLIDAGSAVVLIGVATLATAILSTMVGAWLFNKVSASPR